LHPINDRAQRIHYLTFYRALSPVLLFQNIHGNKNKGFRLPPVLGPEKLDQPEFAVKQGAITGKILA
jgi:hypothetical protein